MERHLKPGEFWSLSREQRLFELGRQRYYQTAHPQKPTQKNAAQKKLERTWKGIKNAAIKRFNERIRREEDGQRD